MIIKETDFKEAANKFQAAGVKAEKQMAFYLKRAYEHSEQFLVFNDLRIEMNGDFAQIDHLIVHRFGFIIIESKSVISTISINEHNEWIRHFGTNASGMPSPIQQARRQAEFLKNFFQNTKVELIKKSALFKASFADFRFDTFVAISDTGIIKRDPKADTGNIFKADQITAEIDKLYASLSKTNWNPLAKIPFEFGPDTMNRIRRFLINSHTPVETVESSEIEQEKTKESAPVLKSAAESLPVKPQTSYNCSKCGSTEIQIAYGQYGYYFKCSSCSGNSKIQLTCKAPACKPKLRKQKLEFYQECSACQSSTLFFTNSQESS